MSGTASINTTGNAGSATKLQTSRSINGTSFNGTGDITTSKWGTSRNIAISGAVSGNANIDGSKNVEISVAQYDTGWVDMSQYINTNFFSVDTAWKPAARRIGNVVYWRGAIIPQRETQVNFETVSYSIPSTFLPTTKVSVAGTRYMAANSSGENYYNLILLSTGRMTLSQRENLKVTESMYAYSLCPLSGYTVD